MLESVLNILQLILAVLLITAIMLQSSGAGLGAIFGGDGGVKKTRRGAEQTIYQVTIVLAILFFGVAIANALI